MHSKRSYRRPFSTTLDAAAVYFGDQHRSLPLAFQLLTWYHWAQFFERCRHYFRLVLDGGTIIELHITSKELSGKCYWHVKQLEFVNWRKSVAIMPSLTAPLASRFMSLLMEENLQKTQIAREDRRLQWRMKNFALWRLWLCRADGRQSKTPNHWKYLAEAYSAFWLKNSTWAKSEPIWCLSGLAIRRNIRFAFRRLRSNPCFTLRIYLIRFPATSGCSARWRDHFWVSFSHEEL